MNPIYIMESNTQKENFCQKFNMMLTKTFDYLLQDQKINFQSSIKKISEIIHENKIQDLDDLIAEFITNLIIFNLENHNCIKIDILIFACSYFNKIESFQLKEFPFEVFEKNLFFYWNLN